MKDGMGDRWDLHFWRYIYKDMVISTDFRLKYSFMQPYEPFSNFCKAMEML